MTSEIDNNLRRQYTVADGKQFEEAETRLAANRLDVKATRNIDLLDEFFNNHRELPVTLQNIYRAVEERKSEFIWLSPAQFEYNKVANQEPDRANQLAAWLATQGSRPGQLVSSGDLAFENLTLLLPVLRGYEVSPSRIRDAEDRISHRPGKQLHRVAEPRRTEARSRAAKADADYSPGKVFSSDMIRNADGSLRSKTFHEQKADREAKEAAEAASRTPDASRIASAARTQADSLKGNNHSEDLQISRVFVYIPGTSEVAWPETYQARLALQRSLNRAQETRRFIR
jgi:hypothetical protein